MNMLISAGKLLLMVLSTLGLWSMVRSRFSRMDISFVPAVTAAIQITFLVTAGMLNILAETAWALYILGFLFLLYTVWKDRGFKSFRQWITPSIIFLAVVTALMAVFLRGKIFAHYDNFTHWALVVRGLLATDRFPNFLDSYITYSDYPLGSAAFIYYICRFTGTAEYMQMVAQTYLLIVNIIPLFSVSRKKGSLPTILMVSAFTYFALTYNNSAADLLVDTLVAAVSMSGILYVILCYDQDADWGTILPIAFLMVPMLHVKNSGIFFALVPVVLMLLKKRSWKIGLPSLLCAAAPFATLYLWHKHCTYVFSNEGISYHAMTLNNYTKVFQEKTPEDINRIAANFAPRVLSWQDTWFALAFLVLAAVLIFLAGRNRGRGQFSYLLLAFILFIVYQIGMLGMYFFSMPAKEAVELAQIYRYEKTIIYAMVFLALVPIIRLLSEEDTGKIMKYLGALAVSCAMILFMSISTGKPLFALSNLDSDYTRDERNWIESARIDYQIQDHESYTVLIPEDDIGGYAYWICRYVFDSTRVTPKFITEEYQIDEIGSRYVLAYDKDNEVIKAWLEKHEGDPYVPFIVVH